MDIFCEGVEGVLVLWISRRPSVEDGTYERLGGDLSRCRSSNSEVRMREGIKSATMGRGEDKIKRASRGRKGSRPGGAAGCVVGAIS